MFRLLIAFTVVVAFALVAGTSSASAHGLTASEKLQAKQTYYHTTGYINAIWKHARRTVYHPNFKVRNKWWATLKYLMNRRHVAWVKLHPVPQYVIPKWALDAFSCIHRYEGAWNSNTGNGYFGGLQMDYGFMSTYGPEFLKQYGTADKWPITAQLQVAYRAYTSGRGFGPWPNTARVCGLL